MKRIFYVLLLCSPALFAMDNNIENDLRRIGVDVSKLEFKPSEIHHVSRNHEEEAGHFYVRYYAILKNPGGTIISATATYSSSAGAEISCYKIKDVLTSWQAFKINIHPNHYHLLRVLYDAQ